MKTLFKVFILIAVGIAVGYLLWHKPISEKQSTNSLPIEIKVTESGQNLVREGNTITITAAYKERLLSEDFSKLLQDADVDPVKVGNEVKGYRLSRIRKHSVYEKAGFKDGDVIESINGKPLDGNANPIKTIQAVKSNSSSLNEK